MENIIQITEEIECDVKLAFDMFITNELLEKWLTTKADVVPKIGGKYELFWEPENKNVNSTIGCKITGIEQEKFISFEWKGPIQFHEVMNFVDPLTHVIVFFSPSKTNQGKTVIHLFHTGWRKDHEWQQARDYFEKAWSIALQEIKSIIKNNGD
ncbi:MAG: SRPBCC domain-containing protein [Candidatus Hodarchaeota archaeon]